MSDLMNRVQKLVEEGDYQQIIALLQRKELTNEIDSDIDTVYKIFLLSYMTMDDINNARFLWKRMLKIKSKPSWDAETNQLHKILVAYWNREPQNVHAALEYEWSPVIVGVITSFVEAYRSYTIHLLARAYVDIQANTLAQKLGMDKDEAIDFLTTKYGWKVIQTDQHTFLETVKPDFVYDADHENDLKQLTNEAIFWELNQA